ncbi:MAG TPA: 2-dehydro-3-deoxyphosphogluconate aldolase [Verrucomicrobiales bacterium]|nr:2-dehydro-3-deoxyphosphogluconate aldolase [Verrucomicrobiales bacterium]
MNELTDQLAALRIIPVVAIDSADDAMPLADALIAGGLPCAEITLRTEDGLKAIRRLRDRRELLVGAGTVHSAKQASESVEAGARFIVSPGFNPRTVAWCLENRVPVFPGIATPTDLESALEFGLTVVKFFPAETLGGVRTLKAFSGPYGGMKFIPTGGISPANLADYLKLECVVACGGSWMVSPAMLMEGRFDEIQRLTAEAVGLAVKK